MAILPLAPTDDSYPDNTVYTISGEEHRTFTGWSNAGWRVKKGEHSTQRVDGKALFSRNQVWKVPNYNPPPEPPRTHPSDIPTTSQGILSRDEDSEPITKKKKAKKERVESPLKDMDERNITL